MLKLLKQYKFMILTLCVCIVGIGSIIYERNAADEGFVLETKELTESTISNEVLTRQNAQLGEEAIEATEIKETSVSNTLPEMVPVYICGAVKEPGVYYISQNALINEAIEVSGGFTDEADYEYLNLASPIQANGKIVVPRIGEQIDKNLNSYDNIGSTLMESTNVNTELLQNDKTYININTASVEELMSLVGIGEKKAMAIKAYREEKGGFKEISELTEVKGIGDGTFENIKEFITVQ